jgi:hypothetical protein
MTGHPHDKKTITTIAREISRQEETSVNEAARPLRKWPG